MTWSHNSSKSDMQCIRRWTRSSCAADSSVAHQIPGAWLAEFQPTRCMGLVNYQGLLSGCWDKPHVGLHKKGAHTLYLTLQWNS